MTAKQRVLKYVPVATVNEDESNPKDHDLGLVHRSIARFGFIEPIIHDGRTDKLISGHGRIQVLRQKMDAGEHPPDGIVLKDGNWCVPVVYGWASRDDAEARAALVALNQAVIAGGWDDSKLADILTDLERLDALDGVGFDAEDLNRLLGDLAGFADGFEEGEPESMPDADETTVFSFGVFRLGGYRFTVPVTEYREWLEVIKQEHGFDDPSVIAAVRTRLGLSQDEGEVK